MPLNVPSPAGGPRVTGGAERYGRAGGIVRTCAVTQQPDLRRRRARPVLLGAALIAAGAAVAFAALPRPFQRPGPPDPCFASAPERCFVSHGAYVMLEGGVVRDRAAVDRALGHALAYWSAPAGALDRWLVTYEDHEVACNGERATGCTSWREGTLRVQVLDPRCPETAQLVHEVGHVVLHDPGHRAAAWCWEAEQEATRALVRGPGASAGCASSPYYTAPVPGAGRCRGP